MPLWMHSLAETFSIVVSMLIFGVAWNAYGRDRPGNITVMGCGFLAVGLIDFAHMLSYEGMPDFVTPAGPEKAINFWLAARLLSALTLLIVSLRPWRPLVTKNTRYTLLLGSLGITALVYWIGLFHSELLPRSFIQGQGLTSFKVGTEYLVSAVLLVPALRFYRMASLRQFDGAIWLFAASVITILSELSFTLYANVTDLFNLLGHVYKVVAFVCIYRAVFVATVREPFQRLRVARDELSSSKNLLQTIVDNVPERIYWKDRMSRYFGANKAFLRDVGLADVTQLIGKEDYTLFPEHAELYRSGDIEVMSSGQAQLNYERQMRAIDGSITWLLVSKVPLREADGEVIGVLGSYTDISVLKQAQESLQKSEAKFRAIIDNTTVPYALNDDRQNITYVNAAFIKTFGYDLQDIPNLATWWPKAYPDEDYRQWVISSWQSHMELAEREGRQFEALELNIRCKDGSTCTAMVSASPLGETFEGSHLVVLFDITEMKQKDALIWTQANYDALTELPNRRLFQDRLDQEIKQARRSGQGLSLLFIDLDRFKEINDTMGHSKGDAVLVDAARRISRCVRDADTVARLGGDEFMVILPKLGDPLRVETIAQHIIQELSNPFQFDNDEMSYYISASIGITLYSDDVADAESMMKRVDQALYAAKSAGRSRFSYFTPSMQKDALEKQLLTHDLRRALARKELQVYYQPILELANGRIVKAEALLRWQHPQRGMIGPATFIPLAEESGLILEIGEWVFDETIANIDRWREQFGHIIQVSVNKSPVQFEQPAHTAWSAKLASRGLPGNSITVEITEGLLLKDAPTVKQHLLEFRNSGIEVSIDDFGTGFSSLSYIKRFDIDYLKVDRSFIKNLTTDESDRALTEAIIVMAHKLGIKTIAEGVETATQRDLLMEFNCDFVQGFYYSPAVPAAQFERMLED
jgi:diguanylate cyclase (GGDEF)-like protein/PAS domain S-box-containing protein